MLAVTGAAGAVALSFGALNAQGGPPQLPGALDASRVEAGTYATDASHSLVGWRVNHFGFNDYFGIFGDVAGTLEIDPADITSAKVDVTIPVASVTTASAGLTDHLLRAAGEGAAAPDFFGPDPAAARFVSTSVHQTGDNTAHIMGDLTLNGVTKPVTVQAEFVGAGANPFTQALTVGFEGHTTITRSEWGLGGFTPLVGDEVELNITIAFEKQ
ncbi:YceI family protein [Alteraurantiacibacter aquimixticola]|uniref:YceI family protein n=1 Tax=Alteraurantiacibacter aquimixticola TaxID=2489173 RepID=A0A4T3F379_9SPHN|nr:YceI family protein [Alteraurantiacibacter aquimixticola]